MSDTPGLSASRLTEINTVPKRTAESVVAEVDESLLTYATNVGLAAPGSVALFRVYVVLTTGNEKGSATVKVTRP